jgi:hypothetical protein
MNGVGGSNPSWGTIQKLRFSHGSKVHRDGKGAWRWASLIVIEPSEDNGVRHGSAIVIDLPAGSTLDQAQELAAALNHGAESIAVKTW